MRTCIGRMSTQLSLLPNHCLIVSRVCFTQCLQWRPTTTTPVVSRWAIPRQQRRGSCREPKERALLTRYRLLPVTHHHSPGQHQMIHGQHCRKYTGRRSLVFRCHQTSRPSRTSVPPFFTTRWLSAPTACRAAHQSQSSLTVGIPQPRCQALQCTAVTLWTLSFVRLSPHRPSTACSSLGLCRSVPGLTARVLGRHSVVVISVPRHCLTSLRSSFLPLVSVTTRLPLARDFTYVHMFYTDCLSSLSTPLVCYTDKNETWRQSLLCGRPSCMEQSTSSSSWSWQLACV